MNGCVSIMIAEDCDLDFCDPGCLALEWSGTGSKLVEACAKERSSSLDSGREGQAPGSHGMHGAIDVYTTSRSSTLPKRSDDVPVLELTDDVSSMSCRPKVREGDGSRDVSGLGCIRFEVLLLLVALECCAYSEPIHAKQLVPMWSLGDKFVHIRMPFLIIVEKQVVPKGINEYSPSARKECMRRSSYERIDILKRRSGCWMIFSTSNYDNLSSEGMVIGVTTLADLLDSSSRRGGDVTGRSGDRGCLSARSKARAGGEGVHLREILDEDVGDHEKRPRPGRIFPARRAPMIT
ncbi:hypothetical protein KC347_g109 [Hortaea werneckii]|nr:hypothetical protein KC347_g109 [Hortaea werneckii]